MLNDTDKDNPTNGQYWPVDNVSEFGPFKIELLQTRDIGCVVNRVLQLSMGDRDPSIIQQFQILGWPPDISTSQFTSAFLELMIMIKRWQEQSGKGPITVHCLNGVGRTGVFCASLSACERIQAEEVVDVYQTVKTLRKQRPNMVETLEQYRMCYEVALHYCDVNVNLYNC
ncbi:receptor-type tyrosine-protein phosphatase alpha-like [Ptychodera flava]|uniref:receptor-type tyrosine-protein phosphatase alpha-like n=1 Tax=Ptychodera flava TaxID=63121 RepID=UPI003969F857